MDLRLPTVYNNLNYRHEIHPTDFALLMSLLLSAGNILEKRTPRRKKCADSELGHSQRAAEKSSARYPPGRYAVCLRPPLHMFSNPCKTSARPFRKIDAAIVLRHKTRSPLCGKIQSLLFESLVLNSLFRPYPLFRITT